MIDDLTVENKKLRQKLRKYEKLHCSKLESDKLFEVRIHALPAYKKQEFEEKLRDFASSIGNSPGRESGEHADYREPAALGHPLLGDKGSSTSPAVSRPADSGYASMSASLKTSTSQLRHSEEPRSLSASQAADQNVRSYLHNLPPGLLPQQPDVLLEKAKTKLVVRRLEQLFTGKVASSAPPFQFLQQQKVSQSAARAERIAKEARGHKATAEGNREARILPTGVHRSSNSEIEVQMPPVLRASDESDEFSSHGLYTSSEATPDQRPTRPLDLDPNRAQVPAENLEYIRHLGLASPRISPDSYASHGGGWVYLNLLINMAQLHTINVTPEFVRKAVKDASEKFELSEDGQKIRWTGGHEGTSLSSDSGSSSRLSAEDLSPGADQRITHSSVVDIDRYNGSGADLLSEKGKQASLNNNLSADFGVEFDRRPVSWGQFNTENLLDYKPLFFYGTRSEEDDNYYLNDSDSLTSSALAEDVIMSYPMNHAERALGNGTNIQLGRKGEGGPIIFYKRAKFCTDLSGDARTSPCHTLEYSRFTDEIVGCKAGLNSEHKLDSTRNRSPPCSESSEYSSRLSHGKQVQNRAPPLRKRASSNEVFRASGIGGVQPRDHFAIEVQTQQCASERKPQSSSCSASALRVRAESLSRRVERSINKEVQNKSQAVTFLVQNKIVSSKTTILAPSALPPLSYIFLPLSSSSDDDDEMPDSSDDHVDMFDHLVEDEAATLPEFSHANSTIASLDSYIVSEEGSEDSSIDLLAHARRLDPDAVAAQEREFESNVVQASKSTFMPRPDSPSPLDLIESDASSCEESVLKVFDSDFESESMNKTKRVRSDDGDAFIRRKVPRIDPGEDNSCGSDLCVG